MGFPVAESRTVITSHPGFAALRSASDSSSVQLTNLGTSASEFVSGVSPDTGAGATSGGGSEEQAGTRRTRVIRTLVKRSMVNPPSEASTDCRRQPIVEPIV